MTDSNTNSARTLNVANQVTVARLAISLILFLALQFRWYGPAIVLFLLGAGTDWLDGYLARSRNLVTQLGRILDPLADKIIICGTFIFLSSASGSQIAAWMTVVVIARELIVTVIRSFLEQQGKDFSAKMPGKVKMVLQCAAAVGSLILLRQANPPAWLTTTVVVLAWVMVISTVHSGWLYVLAASKLLKTSA